MQLAPKKGQWVRGLLRVETASNGEKGHTGRGHGSWDGAKCGPKINDLPSSVAIFSSSVRVPGVASGEPAAGSTDESRPATGSTGEEGAGEDAAAEVSSGMVHSQEERRENEWWMRDGRRWWEGGVWLGVGELGVFQWGQKEVEYGVVAVVLAKTVARTERGGKD